MATPYNKKDMGKDTRSSDKEVTAAGHEFREHSGAREGKDVEMIRPKDIDEGYSATPSGILDRFFGGKE